MRKYNLKRIVKLELYKAWKDSQIRWIFCIMSFYVAVVPFLSVNPEFYQNATVTQLLMDGTADCAMMSMFLGLIGASIFLVDYTYNTYQNLTPYAKKNSLFIGKNLALLIVIAVALITWYAIVFVEAIIWSGQWCTLKVFLEYLSRFINQSFMVLCHAALLSLIGIILKRRALINIGTIVLWFSYAFIPISEKRLFDYVVEECKWGASISVTLLIISCAIFGLCMIMQRTLIYRGDLSD